MKDRRWTHNPELITSDMSYSAVWCTKFRRPLLKDDIKDFLVSCLKDRCDTISVIVDKLEVEEDKVMIDFRTIPTNCPHWVITQLKQYTSGIMREKFINLRKKVPTLWTRAYLIYTNSVLKPDIDSFLDEQRSK